MGKFGIGARVRDRDGDLATVIGKDRATRKGWRQIKYDDPEFAQDVWFDKDWLTPVDDEIELVAAKPAEPALTLRAGGHYKLRNGEVVGPLVGPQKFSIYDAKYEFGVEPHSSRTIWMADGKFSEHATDQQDRDIVAEVEAPAPTLKIEAGKFYRTRDGRKVGPAKVQTFGSEGDFYVSGWNYDADGVCSNLGGDNPLDIVAEWIDEPAEAEAPAFTLEVGKFYKTRDGRKAGPMITSTQGGFKGEVDGDGNGRRVFEADGTHRYSETNLDLVGEWVEPVVEPQPQPKFKKGDRVIFTREDGSLFTQGKVYVASSDSYHTAFERVNVVANDDGEPDGWLAEYFEPAPTDFQVGDVVRFKNLPEAWWFKDGMEGQIDRIEGYGLKYHVLIGGPGGYVGDDHIDLVRRPPATAPTDPFAVGTKVTITGTVHGINGDNRSVVVGTSLAKQVSFDIPASALKAA